MAYYLLSLSCSPHLLPHQLSWPAIGYPALYLTNQEVMKNNVSQNTESQQSLDCNQLSGYRNQHLNAQCTKASPSNALRLVIGSGTQEYMCVCFKSSFLCVATRSFPFHAYMSKENCLSCGLLLVSWQMATLVCH